MDKSLGKEYPPEQRARFLKDNCEKVEETSYMKRYTPEELQQMKEQLSEVAIDINDIEEEKKEVVAGFKKRLEPLTDTRKELLTGLKQKAVLVTENCFKFVDREERMVGYYNAEGDLINARPCNSEELQGSIFQVLRNTGTEN